MSINTDGQKLSGKFLKRNSKLLKAVRLVPYSFHQIESSNNVEFDNSDRSIIHAKFHDPEELALGVKSPAKMEETLIDPSRPPMAIIMPGDFTADWHNERLNNKRRAMGFEDEDDFDDPAIPAREVTKQQYTRPITSTANQVNSTTESPTDQPAQPPLSAQPTQLSSVMAAENSSINADELATHARPVSIVKDPYSSHNAKATEAVVGGGMPSAMSIQESTQDFIPLDTATASQAVNTEDSAIATYKHRAEIEAANASVLEDLKSEAKSEGYNEGFRIGEEKGVLAGQKTAGEIFHRVTELLHEFEGLKRNVLENIQKNFFELSQAVAESLLEREFSIKPESFTKVLEKVLKDTVSDDQFKIRLHPDTWQKVTDLKVESLQGHLVKDASIPVGEFKVESNLTVVDGSVKKIVSQMLQNVDMNLFEETKVAS